MTSIAGALQRRRAPRSLPWDVLLVVFEVADAPSLALLGRVSYDFLFATAPYLYRDVTLESFSQISKMFGERTQEEKVASSRINPFLSLDKLRTLTLDFLSTPTPSSDVLQLFFDRFSSPIPLDTLVVSLPHSDPKEYLKPLRKSLFHQLNPRRCTYMDFNRPWVSSRGPGLLFREEGHSLVEWTRIEVVDLVGCFPYSPNSWEGTDHFEVAFLPYDILPQVQFRFDVFSLLDADSLTPGRFVDSLEYTDWMWGYKYLRDGCMVLVVRSEEEKEEVEAAVALTSTLKKKFSVVLEE